MSETASTPTWRRSSRCDSSACVEVANLGGDIVAIRDSKDPNGPILRLTQGEWSAFVKGIRHGDFDIS